MSGLFRTHLFKNLIAVITLCAVMLMAFPIEITATATEPEAVVEAEGDAQAEDASAEQALPEVSVPWPAGPEIKGPTAIVMEVNSGAVLYEKQADMQSFPASITKILTALLAIENSSMEEVVTFSNDAVFETDGSSIARDHGEEMTMEQCLYGMMLESANECAYAIAEHIAAKQGGTYQDFINLMNERAAALGCTTTHFANSNGLPNENHYTSCRDMALIAAEAYRNEAFRGITGTKHYEIPPTNKHAEVTYLNNHHGMLTQSKVAGKIYEPCTGGKTGYTETAGSTLVTYAEKNGMTLVCVVMREVETGAHYDDTRKLMEYCFNNFQLADVSAISENFANTEELDSGMLTEGEAFATLDKEAIIVVPVGADPTEVAETISYDNVAEDVLGTINFTYGGHQVGCANVVLTGVQAETYEFSQGTGNLPKEETAIVEEDTVDDGVDSNLSVPEKIKQKITGFITADSLTANIIKIVIAAACGAVIVLIIIFIVRAIRRVIRRNRSRDRRYKVIKNNRKWNPRDKY